LLQTGFQSEATNNPYPKTLLASPHDWVARNAVNLALIMLSFLPLESLPPSIANIAIFSADSQAIQGRSIRPPGGIWFSA